MASHSLTEQKPKKMSDDDENMDSRKSKQAGTKRVGFALPDNCVDLDSDTGNAKKRRGTPYPMKRMSDGDDDLLPFTALPPPQFNRTASAALAGIPPHDPRHVVSFEDDEDAAGAVS
jgi:hypothetical protein